jgi:hypothetical protein
LKVKALLNLSNGLLIFDNPTDLQVHPNSAKKANLEIDRHFFNWSVLDALERLCQPTKEVGCLIWIIYIQYIFNIQLAANVEI